MPPGAKKKKAAKRKKEQERKEKLALHHHHHHQQGQLQHLINHPTHGNGHHHHHHHHQEEEDGGRDSEAGSPTHNSPRDSHQSSQSEAEGCEEKIDCLMSTMEENAAPALAEEEREKQEAFPASEPVAKVEDAVMDSVNSEVAADDGAKEVVPASEDAVTQRNEFEHGVPEVVSAVDKVEVKDLEENSSLPDAASHGDEIRDGVPEARQEDEFGDKVPEENAALEVVRQIDEAAEGSLEESSVVEVVRQNDEVTGRVHEESSVVDAVRQINEVTAQVDSVISALKVVKEVDEVKLLEPKIIEVILPLCHDYEQKTASVPDVGDEAIDLPSQDPEQKVELLSDGIIKQPQECYEACCGSNRAVALSASQIVAPAPLAADRAKWWSCCGLFEIFV